MTTYTAPAPRLLADLAVGELVTAVDGLPLREDRAVIAALAPIRPGGPMGVRLAPRHGIEFILYADRDTIATVLVPTAEEPAEAPAVAEVPAPVAKLDRPTSGVPTVDPGPNTQYNPRGLSDVQCYELVRALAADGAVRAHGSCMNALRDRGLAAWIDGRQNRPSTEVRGRLTHRGAALAGSERIQDRARAFRVARGY